MEKAIVDFLFTEATKTFNLFYVVFVEGLIEIRQIWHIHTHSLRKPSTVKVVNDTSTVCSPLFSVMSARSWSSRRNPITSGDCSLCSNWFLNYFQKVLIQSCRQHLKASFASRPARMSKVKSASGLVESWRSHTHKHLYDLTKSITYYVNNNHRSALRLNKTCWGGGGHT